MILPGQPPSDLQSLEEEPGLHSPPENQKSSYSLDLRWEAVSKG